MTTGSQQNQALIPKLYATYKEAGEFIAAHPEEAAALIAPKSTPADRAALVSLIKANDRLGMNVVPAGEVAKQIDAVYKAGVDVGYFKSMPSNDTIYSKPMQMTNSRTMRVAAGRRRHAACWRRCWQILSMFFPRFLFPPVPEIISRTIEILITGSLLVDVLLTAGRIFAGLFGAFILGGMLALVIGAIEDGGEFHLAGADVLPGHSGAVLGGVRHHLVSRHRIPRAVHHGDDDAAGLHLSDSRRLPLDVEGPVRDDHVVPADRAGSCSAS